MLRINGEVITFMDDCDFNSKEEFMDAECYESKGGTRALSEWRVGCHQSSSAH